MPVPGFADPCIFTRIQVGKSTGTVHQDCNQFKKKLSRIQDHPDLTGSRTGTGIRNPSISCHLMASSPRYLVLLHWPDGQLSEVFGPESWHTDLMASSPRYLVLSPDTLTWWPALRGTWSSATWNPWAGRRAQAQPCQEKQCWILKIKRRKGTKGTIFTQNPKFYWNFFTFTTFREISLWVTGTVIYIYNMFKIIGIRSGCGKKLFRIHNTAQNKEGTSFVNLTKIIPYQSITQLPVPTICTHGT